MAGLARPWPPVDGCARGGVVGGAPVGCLRRRHGQEVKSQVVGRLKLARLADPRRRLSRKARRQYRRDPIELTSSCAAWTITWGTYGGMGANGRAGKTWAARSLPGPRWHRGGHNRLDVFAEGTDGKLKHKWWDGSKWHDWQTLGGTFKGMPAAVSWGPDRIDIFVRGMDDHLGHLWWNGNSWQGWEDLGGPITSAPAVASWGANRLDVFAAGPDGNLEHKWWNGQKWSSWDWVGGVFHDQPAAVSWGTQSDRRVRPRDGRSPGTSLARIEVRNGSRRRVRRGGTSSPYRGRTR